MLCTNVTAKKKKKTHVETYEPLDLEREKHS